MDDMTAFERQLASRLQRRAGPPRSVDAMAVARNATTTSPRSRFGSLFRATKFVLAGAIVALFGGFLLAGVLTQPSEDRVPAAASASPSLETGYEVTEVGRPTEAYPSVVTDDALWLVDSDGQAVVRVDALTSELTTISVDSEPQTLVASEDAIWVVGHSDVHRIDRIDRTVSEDPIRRSGGDPFAVSGHSDTTIVADGSLWIRAHGDEGDAFVEIDLATRTIRSEYPSPIAWSESGLVWIAGIDDAIWVQSDGQGARFDLPTRTFTGAVDVPAVHASNVFTSDDGIWLAGGETGQLWRVDPDTLEVTEALALDVGLSGGVAVGDALWLGTWHDYTDDTGWRTDFAVYRFDTRTREVTDVIPAPSGLLDMFDGALWTGYGGDRENELSRIDVDSRRVVGTLKIPSAHKQDALFASETAMWVETSTGRLWRVDRAATVE